MKFLSLLSLACVVCMTLAAPVVEDNGGMKTGSCADAIALSAAGLAVSEINKDRQEGYILGLHRLANVNEMRHAETGVVFYLTMDVVETDCHVLSKKNWRSCEPRHMEDTPVYGQCKATIYINRPQRVVRLYKYKCTIRPVAAIKLTVVCPDCPTHSAMDNLRIVKAISLSLDKFNKESGLSNRFNLDKITRAVSQVSSIMEYYGVEYTIQESTCANNDTTTVKCPLMDCEFAHKGFCKGSFSISMGVDYLSVNCSLYEPETAKEQKKLHLLGGETDHSHTSKSKGPHDHDHTHSHDHNHNHTKNGHDHAGHRRPHGHGHAKTHGLDHVHSQHGKTHNHSADNLNQHHQHAHGDSAHTHDHDHDLALDHNHQHTHLHEHEHHHRQRERGNASTRHHHQPQGIVIVLPPMGKPVTLPAILDAPAAGPEVPVPLPLIPDPDIPHQREPTIQPFPSAVAADCPAVLGPGAGNMLVNEAFATDPMFKTAGALTACLLVLWLAVLQRSIAHPDKPDCQSPEVVSIAEKALEWVNRDRTQGYILSFNSLYDVQPSTDQEKGRSIYKLTIDVLETKCHVTSRKPWKQCDVRGFFDIAVYGECVVYVFDEAPFELQRYFCALRQVPIPDIMDQCPDCPTPDRLDDPIVMDTTKLSLQRFNAESTLSNYFSLQNITRASSKWIEGPVYNVEFTIHETECSRENNTSDDLANCPPMNCPLAHKGFCWASHTSYDDTSMLPQLILKREAVVLPIRPPVEVTCEIYAPEAARVEEHNMTHQGGTDHHQHNHTHLHPGEHEHSSGLSSDPTPVSQTPINPMAPLGNVLHVHHRYRPSPEASSCPGPRRHNLGFEKLNL
ncbi:unnamed protein product [Lota lota]